MNKSRKDLKLILVIFFSIIVIYNLNSQVNYSIDTIYIKKEYVKLCTDGFSLTMSAGKCYYNGKEIDRKKYDKLDKFAIEICDSLLDYATGKYCKFYNKDSIVVDEGIWYREFYTGIFKSYYDNGKIKVLGQYTEDKDSPDVGNRVGKWYFYAPNGKVKKVLDYPKKKGK